MTVLGENDIVQIILFPDGRIATHGLVSLDQRGLALLDFVKMWGHAAGLAEAVVDCGEQHQPHLNKAKPSADLAMKAAEIIESVWDEARNRGWVVKVPAYAPEPNSTT